MITNPIKNLKDKTKPWYNITTSIDISDITAQCLLGLTTILKPYCPSLFLTHRGGEDDDTEDVHPVTCSFPSADDYIRGRSQIQGKVLNVSAIVVLDSVDELPSGGRLGLGLAHCRLGFHAVFNASSILLRTGQGAMEDNKNSHWCYLHVNKQNACQTLELSVLSPLLLPAEMWPGPGWLGTCCCKKRLRNLF